MPKRRTSKTQPGTQGKGTIVAGVLLATTLTTGIIGTAEAYVVFGTGNINCFSLQNVASTRDQLPGWLAGYATALNHLYEAFGINTSCSVKDL
jgi:hypothetical protein